MDDVTRAGARIVEPVMSINVFEDDGDRVVVHACVGFAGDAPPLRRAEIARLPGGAFATLEHEGPYETLALAHHALFAWVQERGRETEGAVWEFYRNDPADVAPEALVTGVALPILP